VNFHIADVSSMTPTKGTFYLYDISTPNFSYMFQCISQHLQGALMYSYSKPSAFTQLLSMVDWLSHKIWKIQLCWFTIFLQWLKSYVLSMILNYSIPW